MLESSKFCTNNVIFYGVSPGATSAQNPGGVSQGQGGTGVSCTPNGEKKIWKKTFQPCQCHASISAFEAPGWSFATLGVRHFRWHHVGWFPVNFRWSLEKFRRAQECWRKNSRKAPQEMSKTSLFPPWMLPSRYRRSHWSDPKLTSGPDAKAGWRLPFLGHFWTYPCEPLKIARLIGTKFQNLPKLLGNIGYDDNL